MSQKGRPTMTNPSDKPKGARLQTVVTALAVLALVFASFAVVLLQWQATALRNEVDALETEMQALHEELESGGHGEGAGTGVVQLPPTVNFTLAAYLDGFVGVGGAIDGVTNPVLAVQPGDVVAITIVNGETIGHDFVIDVLGVHSAHLETQGAEATVLFVAPKAGAFPYICSVLGHREAGMEGVLQVVP
jgi:nitrite reductase (NO-forming)